MYEFSVGEGKNKIYYKIESIGNDLDITITGGKAHIGSILLITNHSYNFFNLPNHREDELLIPFIKKFRNYNEGTILIKAGVHVDNISSNEIKEILLNNQEAIELIEKYINSL